MRMLAVIFSAIGFYGLLLLVNADIYHFMPTSSGPEGGMIDLAIGLVYGGISSLIALAFAIISFFRARNTKSSRLIFAWCCFVTLGFVIVFTYMMMGYYSAHTS